MKKILLLSGLLLLATASFAQTPTVASAVNAASYTLAGLPNAPLAQGSIFILFGTNMGPGTLQGAPSLPLQPTLAGTSIKIASGSTTVSALMIYTSAGQVAAVLPSNTPVGTDSLTLTFNGQTSAAFSIQVIQNNFGIFTLNQGGTGAAVILDVNNVPITSLHAAAPGQVVVLWGTGLGPISPTLDAQGAPGGDMTNVSVEVIIGTAHATIDYRGRAPGFAGLDQINFHVPAGQLGCNVSVAVKINNIVSNLTSMAIGNGGACSDANGFDANTLQLLNSKGSLNIGSILLSKISSSISVAGFTLPPTTTEGGTASFNRETKDVLLQGSSSSGFSEPSIGSCVILTARSGSGSGGSGTVGITGLDAGPAITVNGPNGSRQLPKFAQSPGLYNATLSSNGQPAYIVPGTYTFSGTGGADIGAFSVTASGSPINWTNAGNISAVNRSQDLNITWSGGTAGAFVEIIGSSAVLLGNVSTSATFICIAPATAGQFSVPSAVLLALPVTSSTSIGILSVAGASFSTVSIPGLDFAIAGFLYENSQSVTYQ